jgi:Tat protein secretion system quality control protein TatD with DNase activity
MSCWGSRASRKVKQSESETIVHACQTQVHNLITHPFNKSNIRSKQRLFFHKSYISLQSETAIMSEAKSIHDIIRQHPRERLLVQPLEWTRLHLELLKCSFQEEATDNLPEESESSASEVSGSKKSVDRDARSAERLATSEMKNAAIKKLVAEDGGPLRFQR